MLFDMRSRGRSEWITNAARLSLQHDVDDIEAVRQRTGIGRTAVFGWSYTGAVAALYASQHPEVVERLLLVCSIPPRGQIDDEQEREAVRARSRSLVEKRITPYVQEQLDELNASALREAAPAEFRRRRWLLEGRRQFHDATAMGRTRGSWWMHDNEDAERVARRMEATMAGITTLDVRSPAARIRCPTLVVYGEEDLIAPSGSRLWAQLIPDARVLPIGRCGHWPWLEAPERFFPAVDAFLSGSWPPDAVEV